MVFVDPPIAISSVNASSKASLVTMVREVRSCSTRCKIRRAASSARSFRRGSIAKMEPLPGSANPSASMMQFIELAVNMPEHEPQEGQAKSSSCFSPSSSIAPRAYCPTPSKTEIRSTFSPLGRRPAFIGPPDIKMTGISKRRAPISMPGTILSQLGIQTSPSSQCAAATVSTESAMISREGSE